MKELEIVLMAVGITLLLTSFLVKEYKALEFWGSVAIFIGFLISLSESF